MMDGVAYNLRDRTSIPNAAAFKQILAIKGQERSHANRAHSDSVIVALTRDELTDALLDGVSGLKSTVASSAETSLGRIGSMILSAVREQMADWL